MAPKTFAKANASSSVKKDLATKGAKTKTAARADPVPEPERPQELDTLGVELVKFQKGQLTREELEARLSAKDMQRLWKKHEYQLKKTPQAQEGWTQICRLGRADHKDSKKRQLLFAFLKDGKIGAGYYKTMGSLTVSKSNTKELVWKTYKEITDKHGKEEADAMILAGTIAKKRSSQDRRFWVYLGVTETQTLTVQQRKAIEAHNDGKLKGQQFEALMDGATTVEADDALLEDLWAGDCPGMDAKAIKAIKDMEANPELGSEEEEEEEEEGGVPKKIGQGSQSKGKSSLSGAKKSLAEKLDNLSNCADDSLQRAVNKASQMHSFLTKSLQGLKVSEKGNKGNKLLLPKHLTQLVSSKADLQKSLDQVDQVIVNRPPVEKIKKVLVVAAAACKKADVLHTTLADLQKPATEKE